MLLYSPLTCHLPVSYIDVPELSALASTCHYLAALAADPILQRTRLLVVTPSRLSHSLFAIGPGGSPLRPTMLDLIRRGVMKGLDIERRSRAGLYLYSALARIPPFFMMRSMLIGTLHSLWPTTRNPSSCNAVTRQMLYPLNCVVGRIIQTR